MRAFHLIVLVVGLSMACRSDHAARSRDLSDARIIDCVGGWTAGKVWLKFWGEHPDYAPDYGQISPREDVYEDFRYFVDGSRMRLWLDRGRKLADVKFELKTVEETAYVYKYKLVFADPVFGVKTFDGLLPKSYHCKAER